MKCSSVRAGAATEDDNNDGLLNLAAYFLGEPVTGAEQSDDGMLWSFSTGPTIHLIYSSPLSVKESQASSEVTSNLLSGWGPGPSPVELRSSITRRYYEITIPVTGTVGFARLRIDK